MNLQRLKLRPRSAWRTPWQADTLTGLLCATCARTQGPEVLRRRLIEPMLAGQPPFVLSDACPGDLLPVPVAVRAREWPAELWKSIKRARWLTRDTFSALCRAEEFDGQSLLSHMCDDADLLLSHVRHHNTLSRLSDTTGEAESGLGLFNRPDIHLRTHTASRTPNERLGGADYLSLYIRAVDADALDLLLDLLHILAETGFGADIATGRGQFDVAGEPESVPGLDDPPEHANGVICLSTFQPGPADPVQGYWEAFPKFGKLGPDLRLRDQDTHKNTLIMFRPGACFRADSPRPFLGRAIPMVELVPTVVAEELSTRGFNVIHPAFGLAVPAVLNLEGAAQ